MRKCLFMSLFISFTCLFLTSNFCCQDNREENKMQNQDSDEIKLPPPAYTGPISVEEALHKRRSIRDYSKEPLTIKEISQILWAAQGITEDKYKLRTTPSAGALYPLEIYIAVSNVKDLSAGLYKYIPRNHTVKKISDGDKLLDISNAALRQDAIENSSAIILIAAVYERTAVKYSSRTERYVDMEVGAAAQNIYLQSVSLEIGTVIMGAFKDDALKNILRLPENENPLAIMPLGKI